MTIIKKPSLTAQMSTPMSEMEIFILEDMTILLLLQSTQLFSYLIELKKNTSSYLVPGSPPIGQ